MFHLFFQQIMMECLECPRAGQTWAYLNGASSLEGKIGYELVKKTASEGVCNPAWLQ